MKRPPVYVEKRKPAWPGGPNINRWACDARLQAAQFQSRRDPRRTAIVHRSTKYKDRWQVSFFDADGAASDLNRGSCAEALKELPPRAWRLRELTPKR